MENYKDQNVDSDSILATVGESYEYARIIVKNNLEIKRLETLKIARDAAGKLALTAMVGLIIFIISILLIILMIYGFFMLIHSFPLAIVASIGVLAILAAIIYTLRRFLFYKAIQRGIDKLAKLHY